VVLAARSADKLEVLATGIRAAGGQATVAPCDLSKPSAAQRLYDEVMRRDLAVDTLVNNAGFGHWGHFHEEPLPHLSEMIQVNVTALTELTRLFVPSLVAQQGTVLNLASTVAFQPAPGVFGFGRLAQQAVLQIGDLLVAGQQFLGIVDLGDVGFDSLDFGFGGVIHIIHCTSLLRVRAV
jgi:NADP-dependent 3-hydroxy acid dehydrogenase YdfG